MSLLDDDKYNKKMKTMNIFSTIIRLVRFSGTYLKFVLTRILKRKYSLYILLFIAFVFIFRLIHWMKNNHSPPTLLDNFKLMRNSDTNNKMAHSHKYDNWIVITTIYYPTYAIKELAKFKNWNLLVVGDKKTPANWNSPNVLYLGVEDQKKLGYSIVDKLPYNRYIRKMIGYLFAIQHGAKQIYETDDDNIPLDNLLNRLEQFNSHARSLSSNYLLLVTGQKFFNPYPNFGQSKLWPRGYPLSLISTQQSHIFRACATAPRNPSITQFLVDNEPDVDSLYRLTRRESGNAKSSKLNLNFDPQTPGVVLPSGTFAPFNSQNTLFTEEVFWSLFLPVSTTDRETDIFRSYWTQKLIWLRGDQLKFDSATVKHIRMKRDVMIDFNLEEKLRKIESFVETVDSWDCSDGNSFHSCILSLSEFLVQKGHWSSDDYELLESWLSDLRNIGYDEERKIFSKVIDNKVIDNEKSNSESICSSKFSSKIIYHPIEQKNNNSVRLSSLDDNKDLANIKNLKINLENLNNLNEDTMAYKFTYLICNKSTNFYLSEIDSILKDIPIKMSINTITEFVINPLQSASGNSYKTELTLIISIHNRSPTEIIPYIQATYYHHFQTIIYCIEENENLDLPEMERFLINWKLNAVIIPYRRHSAVNCILAAKEIGLSADKLKAYFHISDAILINFKNPKAIPPYSDLMWLADVLETKQVAVSFDNKDSDRMEECQAEDVRCFRMSKYKVGELYSHFEATWPRLQASGRPGATNNRRSIVFACLKKMEKSPEWAVNREHSWLADPVFSIPTNLLPVLELYRDALWWGEGLGNNFKTGVRWKREDALALLLLECEQVTVDYLSRSSYKDFIRLAGDAAMNKDYEPNVNFFFPFEFKRLERNKEYKKEFCKT